MAKNQPKTEANARLAETLGAEVVKASWSDAARAAALAARRRVDPSRPNTPAEHAAILSKKAFEFSAKHKQSQRFDDNDDAMDLHEAAAKAHEALGNKDQAQQHNKMFFHHADKTRHSLQQAGYRGQAKGNDMSKQSSTVKSECQPSGNPGALTDDTGTAGGDRQSRCECGGGWGEDDECELCGAERPPVGNRDEEDEPANQQAAEDFAARARGGAGTAVHAGAAFGNKNAEGPHRSTAIRHQLYADAVRKTALARIAGNNAKTSDEHENAAALHMDAAEAHRDSSEINHKERGYHESRIDEHERQGALHMSKVNARGVGGTAVRATWSDAARQAALEARRNAESASQSATELGFKAMDSGAAEHHAAAEKAHERAAGAHAIASNRHPDDSKESKHHWKQMKFHLSHADNHKALAKEGSNVGAQDALNGVPSIRAEEDEATRSEAAKRGWDGRHIGHSDDAVAQHIHQAIGVDHAAAEKTRMAGGTYFRTEKPGAVGPNWQHGLQEHGWKVAKSLRSVGGVHHDIEHESGAKAGLVVDNDGGWFDIQHVDPAPEAVSEHAEAMSVSGDHKAAYKAHENAGYAHGNAGNREKSRYHSKKADEHFAKYEKASGTTTARSRNHFDSFVRCRDAGVPLVWQSSVAA